MLHSWSANRATEIRDRELIRAKGTQSAAGVGHLSSIMSIIVPVITLLLVAAGTLTLLSNA